MSGDLDRFCANCPTVVINRDRASDMLQTSLPHWVADRVRGTVGNDNILLDNWEGEAPLAPLIQDLLAQEAELIGDARERILGYIRYEFLVDVEKRG